jgi:glycosyltransferase involved in cell wall biosynthesis
MTISAIGVVVPARNEELLLPACLDSLEVAVARAAPTPVVVVVVLDCCTDASTRVVAERHWVKAVSIDSGNVGMARRVGTDVVLEQCAGTALGQIWLAHTDADSTVPPDWLTGQLALAADGWEVVVGTVAVADWSEHRPAVSLRWAAEYSALEHHPHIHGANLGLTAASYVAAGGWSALPAHEDVDLIQRLGGRRAVSTATLPVVTSARRDPRARDGFGDALNGIAG